MFSSLPMDVVHNILYSQSGGGNKNFIYFNLYIKYKYKYYLLKKYSI